MRHEAGDEKTLGHQEYNFTLPLNPGGRHALLDKTYFGADKIQMFETPT